MLFTAGLLLNVFGVIIATFILVIAFFKWQFTYWRNRGVQYLEPSIPFGNFADNVYQNISNGELFSNFYNTMKTKNIIHAGSFFFHIPIYIPLDLDLIKHIMQVDFIHFTDHISYVNEKYEPLSAHVFSLEGQKWKNLRNKLTPTFTSGKMKNMFGIVVRIANELTKVLEKECENRTPIDAKDLSARLTTDIIGNCAFGIDCNSLINPDTEFRVQGKRLFTLTNGERFQNFLCFLFPSVMKVLGIGLFPTVSTEFFMKVIKETVDYRRKNNVHRNDALQLLLDMMNKDEKENHTTLTFNELAAQAFVFFIAGFETSSTLMSFALLELSLTEEVQIKLRDEINRVLKKHNNELTYDALSEMHYMDMVVSETLRKYPPLPTLTRICTKEYRVPNTDVVLAKGQMVFIPIQGIHYDPEIYPDPQKFEPTRFTDENKSKRHQFAFLPFGEGPRICLGLRFGLMQAKVGLTTLVQNFKFTLNPQTVLPLKMDPKNFLTASLGKIWIDVERINN